MLTNEKSGIERILDKGGIQYAQTRDGNNTILLPKEIVNPPASTQSPLSPEYRDKFNKSMDSMSRSPLQKSAPTSDEYLNLFNYYVSSVLESKVSARMDRYRQMDFILKNDPALSLARRVLKDEVLQDDVFSDPILVSSKNYAFKKKIQQLLKGLGVKNLIREASNNIISYGDAFWIMDAREKDGVTKVIPISPYDVKHRFEFSIAEIKAQRKKMLKRFSGLQALIDAAASVESRAIEFNKVLLGFQVLDSVFPFWQVCHFRRFTTEKDLEPFGMPMFYESQSEARMYLNAKVIISMIRSSAFMKEHVKVKTSEDMDPAEQWQLVNDVRQMVELYTSKNGKTNKDLPSFGDKMYFPDGLMSVEKLEAGFNFRDRFEDLQLMREDVFNSTGMPKGYFVGESNYTPVKALMQQDKKTARMVYEIQSIVVSQLIKIVETHFSLTKEFDPYTEEFSIALPYPIPDIDETMIGISQAKVQYASSAMDSLKMSLGIPKLPEDVVKMMLLKYYSMTDQEIGSVIQAMQQSSVEQQQRGIDPYGVAIGDPFLANKNMADQAELQTQMMTAQMQGGAPVEGQEGTPQPEQPDSPEQPKAEQPKQEGYTPDSEEIETIAKMTPDFSAFKKAGYPNLAIAELIKKRYASANKNTHNVETVNEELYQRIANQTMNEVYAEMYREAVKQTPIHERLEEIMDKEILSNQSEEFIFMGRHHVTNSFTSTDHNQHLYVNEAQHAKVLNETKENKLGNLSEEDLKEDGIDPLEIIALRDMNDRVYKMGDRPMDKTFMTKEELLKESVRREVL